MAAVAGLTSDGGITQGIGLRVCALPRAVAAGVLPASQVPDQTARRRVGVPGVMNLDMLDGFAQSTTLVTLAATAIGCLIGLIVGMIPGMTISTGIIIVLPLTFVLPPDISIALLLGLYVSGMTGGSFSAILLNIPGTPSASATALDGHPMASRGEAGRALARG